MTVDTRANRDHTFWIGLLTGTLVGVGLATWFRPEGVELRQRVSDAARELGASASDRFQQASTRVDEAVDDLTRRGQRLRHTVAETIVRGAHEAERLATTIKPADPITDVKS